MVGEHGPAKEYSKCKGPGAGISLGLQGTEGQLGRLCGVNRGQESSGDEAGVSDFIPSEMGSPEFQVGA